MPYAVKEIFYTLQGEGVHAGTPSVFVRFSGCNLWNGREEDRGKGTGGCAAWCDTDFVGINGERGGKYTADELVAVVNDAWGSSTANPFLVLTGGEPLLQVDDPLLDAFHAASFTVAIETNGTVAPDVTELLDWVCLSPKPGGEVLLPRCDELKLVWPQSGTHPDEWTDFPTQHRFLQPCWTSDVSEREANAAACIDYCLKNPSWRLSVQTHKVLGLS